MMLRGLRISAPVGVGILFLAAWQAVVRLDGIPPYILPAPTAVALSLWTDGPSLFGSLLVTLRITLAALAAAAFFGGALALLFSRSRILELSLFPYAVILQVTPIATCWRCSDSMAPRRGRPCFICGCRRRCRISWPGSGSAAGWR